MPSVDITQLAPQQMGPVPEGVAEVLNTDRVERVKLGT